MDKSRSIPEWAEKKIKNSFIEVLFEWRATLYRRSSQFLDDGNIEDSNKAELIISGIDSEIKRRKHSKSVDTNRTSGIPEEGVMSVMGYHVGITKGEKPEIRRRILTDIYNGPIIMVGSLEHMEEWGEDSSVKRLNKIKRNLKRFIFSNKNKAHHSTAIKEWEEDLDWVEKNFDHINNYN